jgi:hypothetical protein
VSRKTGGKWLVIHHSNQRKSTHDGAVFSIEKGHRNADFLFHQT